MFGTMIVTMLCSSLFFAAPLQSKAETEVEVEFSKFEQEQWTKRAYQVKELVIMWTKYLDENHVKQSDPRRKQLQSNAIALIEALIKFDYLIPYEQLPELALRDLHLIIGVIPIHESALKPHVIGKRGEIGMFQIKDHYPRMGYSKKEILNSPKLQICTGVRWFLIHMVKCKNLGAGEWSDWQWNLPMTVYMAGSTKGIKEDGTCYAIRGSKKRVKTFKKYKRIVKRTLF